MRSYKVVVFDRHERETVKRVLPSIAISFPDYYDDKSNEAHLTKAIKAVAHGYELTHEVLMRARAALERQVAQCAIEADVEHWKRTLLRPAPPGTADEGAGSALVVDPVGMCNVLAEARSLQLREATRALEVVNEALGLATPRPDPEEMD